MTSISSLLFCAGLGVALLSPAGVLAQPAAPVRHIIAAYAQPIAEAKARTDGLDHLDTAATITRLKELHVNTYFYMLSRMVAWEDFNLEFLPAAAAAGIDVVVYVLPPSETKPEYLPFGHDYVRLAEEIARLSLKYSNLRGMAVDDFGDNASFGPPAERGATAKPKLFTPEYVARVRAAARRLNPAFRFYPLLYWSQIQAPALIEAFAPAIDGVIFAYRDEPACNTSRADSLREQLSYAEDLLAARGKSLILMAYCWELVSVQVSPTPDYVSQVLSLGLDDMRAGKLEGVVTYSLDLGGPGLPYRSLRQVRNFAHGGVGRAAIIASNRESVPAGSYGEISASVAITPGAPVRRLGFWHLSAYPSWHGPSSSVLQVLWNDRVVWEQKSVDRQNSPPGVWQHEVIDCGGGPADATAATLRFRVLFKVGAPASSFVASFDDLEPGGFTVADPGFESAAAWRMSQNHHALIPMINRFDPRGRLVMFDAVSELYREAGPTR